MKIVVALGGNALGDTPEEMSRLADSTAKTLVELIKCGHTLVVTHGNGPQVGMINLAFDTASQAGAKVSQMPFYHCTSMSQGYIGVCLQNAIKNNLHSERALTDVVTVVTQVVVDEQDSAFSNPTKPVGAFYDKEKAQEFLSQGYEMVKFDDGYRRVVPSPKPIDIIEKNTIRSLVDGGNIVIAVGGGGVPVVKHGNTFCPVSAVIDKDYASALLAEQLGANMLLILTAVDKVSLDFNTPNQKQLDTLTVGCAKRYASLGQFGKGSMLPKVQACVDFVEKSGKTAVIARLDNAVCAVNGTGGTKVIVG